MYSLSERWMKHPGMTSLRQYSSSTVAANSLWFSMGNFSLYISYRTVTSPFASPANRCSSSSAALCALLSALGGCAASSTVFSSTCAFDSPTLSSSESPRGLSFSDFVASCGFICSTSSTGLFSSGVDLSGIAASSLLVCVASSPFFSVRSSLACAASAGCARALAAAAPEPAAEAGFSELAFGFATAPAFGGGPPFDATFSAASAFGAAVALAFAASAFGAATAALALGAAAGFAAGVDD
mmetsp:Transcript_13084/g.29745  ORF Transcript_13084/g.29745 Transcript_13084/m.29745 type:complete len:241 (-) Transcript_13084:99-821(-)